MCYVLGYELPPVDEGRRRPSIFCARTEHVAAVDLSVGGQRIAQEVRYALRDHRCDPAGADRCKH